MLFYFTADGRIDFRELVKDLASVFKTRIELRQIGVRDETKIRGGIGICGRPLCCHSYLSDFVPVSIKMAKEQNLSLNPTKISGVCGRLMCCLKNEEDTYEELNRKLPGVGDYVQTADRLHGEVQSVNVLRQLVKVLVEAGDDKELKEYEADTLQFKRRRGKRGGQELSKEEQKELEKLEEIEEKEEAEERAENVRSSVRTAESRELTERIVVTTVEKTADATDAGTTTAEIITAGKITVTARIRTAMTTVVVTMATKVRTAGTIIVVTDAARTVPRTVRTR